MLQYYASNDVRLWPKVSTDIFTYIYNIGTVSEWKIYDKQIKEIC